MSIKVESDDINAGYAWLLWGGGAAIAFVLFLIWVDINLTNSNRENELEATLKELRGAQSSLTSDITDQRQKFHLPIRENELAGSSGQQSDHQEN